MMRCSAPPPWRRVYRGRARVSRRRSDRVRGRPPPSCGGRRPAGAHGAPAPGHRSGNRRAGARSPGRAGGRSLPSRRLLSRLADNRADYQPWPWPASSSASRARPRVRVCRAREALHNGVMYKPSAASPPRELGGGRLRAFVVDLPPHAGCSLWPASDIAPRTSAEARAAPRGSRLTEPCRLGNGGCPDLGRARCAAPRASQRPCCRPARSSRAETTVRWPSRRSAAKKEATAYLSWSGGPWPRIPLQTATIATTSLPGSKW